VVTAHYLVREMWALLKHGTTWEEGVAPADEPEGSPRLLLSSQYVRKRLFYCVRARTARVPTGPRGPREEVIHRCRTRSGQRRRNTLSGFR
jgi:hypothetical protein